MVVFLNKSLINRMLSYQTGATKLIPEVIFLQNVYRG